MPPKPLPLLPPLSRTTAAFVSGAPVAASVWTFEVSGLKVVQSWLGYRLKNRKGKKSSPLDDITSAGWPSEFTTELLKLLHLLEETLALYLAQAELLDTILNAPLLVARQLSEPPESYRDAPKVNEGQQKLDV